MRVAVLCYHSQNIQGNTYALNDHIAFEQDIKKITERKLPIISVEQLVEHLKGTSVLDISAAVVLTCDDGTSLDWLDYQHPEFGFQKSFNNILRQEIGSNLQKSVMTSFVIACPTARRHIDKGCYAGAALSHDNWWLDAEKSGYWSIENHSWDHWHFCLPFQTTSEQPLGQFYTVDNYLRASKQVAQASRFINAKLVSVEKAVKYFAYPYGHAASYLKDHYLPYYYAQHGIDAAFTTEADFVTEASSLFSLPRFVCGEAWKSLEQFDFILEKLVEK